MAGSSRKNRDSTAKTLMMFGGGAVLLFFLFFFLLQSNQPPERTASEREEAFKLAKQPMLGKADAPVTLIEFADFKCPACQAFAGSYMPAIKKELIDSGIAKMYFINFPFLGPDSKTAAMAVESVHQHEPDKFWAFYELIFQNQGPENEQWATIDRLKELAAAAGVSANTIAKMTEEVNAGTQNAAVEEDLAIGSSMRVNSTPTIFINDEMFPNSKGWDKIVETVKQKVNTKAK